MHSRLWLGVIAAFLGAICALDSAAAEGSLQPASLWKRLPDWDVRVDHTLGPSCFLVALYKSGTAVRIGLDQINSQIYLLLGNDAWAWVVSGQRYDLTFQFNAGQSWATTATAIRVSGDSIALSTSFSTTQFLSEFVAGKYLAVSYSGRPFAALDLRGTSEAGIELMACQKAMATTKAMP